MKLYFRFCFFFYNSDQYGNLGKLRKKNPFSQIADNHTTQRLHLLTFYSVFFIMSNIKKKNALAYIVLEVFLHLNTGLICFLVLDI